MADIAAQFCCYSNESKEWRR